MGPGIFTALFLFAIGVGDVCHISKLIEFTFILNCVCTLVLSKKRHYYISLFLFPPSYVMQTPNRLISVSPSANLCLLGRVINLSILSITDCKKVSGILLVDFYVWRLLFYPWILFYFVLNRYFSNVLFKFLCHFDCIFELLL